MNCKFCPDYGLLFYWERMKTAAGIYTDRVSYQCKNCSSIYCFREPQMELIYYVFPMTDDKYYGIAYVQDNYFAVNKIINIEAHNNHATCEEVLKLNYIPDNITPKNFSEKLKTLITFS